MQQCPGTCDLCKAREKGGIGAASTCKSIAKLSPTALVSLHFILTPLPTSKGESSLLDGLAGSLRTVQDQIDALETSGRWAPVRSGLEEWVKARAVREEGMGDGSKKPIGPRPRQPRERERETFVK